MILMLKKEEKDKNEIWNDWMIDKVNEVYYTKGRERVSTSNREIVTAKLT